MRARETSPRSPSMLLAIALAVLFGGFMLVILGVFGAAALRARGADPFVVVDASGQKVSSSTFSDAGAPMLGLAPVRVDERWGYVDAAGALVIAPAYPRAAPFDASGFAEATDGETGRTGLIDARGGWALAPTWDYVHPPSDGRAVVEAQVGLRTSRITTASAVYSAGLVALPDQTLVAPAPQDAPERWLQARGPREGRLMVSRAEGWRIADRDGQLVSEAVFTDLWWLSGGLAAAAADDGRYGYVDADGAWVVAPRWQAAEPHVDGLAIARDEAGWHLLDAQGAVVAGPFDQLLTPSEGLVAAEQGGQWGFIDGRGAWVIAPQFAKVGDEGFRHGRARVGRPAGLDYAWAWVGRDGVVANDAWYAEITPWGGDFGLARTR